jgi:hypothetical protein
MNHGGQVAWVASCALVAGLVLAADGPAGTLNFGPEQIVQAGGFALTVPGYSVPYYFDWDSDGRSDLIVGQGGGGQTGKVRVYLNQGTSSQPQFSDYQYVQSLGRDLEVGASGCLGVFPRLMDYDADDDPDLLLGLADGQIQWYRNTGTRAAPTFDAGQFVELGPVGSRQPLDCGGRATLSVVDWNHDGLQDLVAGSLDGRLRLYLNEGVAGVPEFLHETILAGGDGDLRVPGDRSSPVIVDLDGDGEKDLLAGNTNGEILFYRNQASGADPLFSDYVHVTSDDVVIDLPGMPRSRPTVTDWTGDGWLDLLVGSADGTIRLYQGQSNSTAVPLQAGDANQDLRFDQLDLFQVLRGAKYLTGQAATWGEGNWNGAPGGNPGSPPEGDGVFNTLDVLAALRSGTWLTGPYGATDSCGAVTREATGLAMEGMVSEDLPLAVAVPEPTGLSLVLLGLAGCLPGLVGRPTWGGGRDRGRRLAMGSPLTPGG